MRKLLLSAAASVLVGSLAFGQTVFIDEDFESGFPSGWSQGTNASDGGWLIGTGTSLSSTYFPIEDHTTIIATNDDGCNCDKSGDSLFVASVDLTSASGLVLLQYDVYFFELSYNGVYESLDIYVEANGSWSLLESIGPSQSGSWDDEQVADLSSYIGEEIVVAFVYNDGGEWSYGAGLDNISIYEAPTNDLGNISIDNDPYHEVNTAATIVGTVQNMGGATVTSFEISYTVDGGTPVTGTISGVSIAPLATYSYSHPTTWTPTAEMMSTVVTEIVSVNGNTDENASNDEASLDINVHPTPVTRKPILEQFTSSTCPPCTPGNANVLAVMGNFSGQYSKVNYQMSWPGNGDPYYTLEGNDRRTFYAVNSVPSMHTDGSVGLNSNSFTASVFTNAQDVPAFVNLDVSATVQKVTTYAVEDGELVVVSREYELNADCEINPVVNLSSGLVAHLSVNENLTFNNVETNGETEFHDVMKKMLPDAYGTTLGSISANDTFSFSEFHAFPTTYRLPNDAGDPIDHSIEHSVEEWDDLRIVGWVQDPNTGEIWQSENAEITLLDSTDNIEEEVIDGVTVYTINGVSYEMIGDQYAPLGTESGLAPEIGMFPNPANNMINFTGVSNNTVVKLYDAAGRLVKQDVINNASLNVSDLESGVYNVVLENDAARRVEKITIAH